ncbi:MAG: hypothetical protein K2X48_02295 [Chitinophagaceae bacterium]|nr:hypothetical protein [Chitinophagaceae bacterium]
MQDFKKTALFLMFFLLAVYCYTQTKKVDGLVAQLKKTTPKEERLNIILSICEEYQSLNRDTLYNLALEARQLSASQPDKEKKALAAIALSDAYMQWGWTDSALASISPMLADEKVLTPGTYYKMLRRKAMIYGSHADFEKALSILYPALSGAEKWKDTLNIAAIINSIGSISMARGKPDEAREWIKKAAALTSGNGKYKTVLAAVYTNAANMYLQKDNADSAKYYIQLALPLCREIENLFILATALRIQVNVLTAKKKFPEAEAALKEMIAIRKLTMGTNFFIEDNLLLADFYANTGQLEKAISFCREKLKTGNIYDTTSAQTSVFTNDPKLRLDYSMALAKYYKQANRLNESQEILEQVVLLKDSLYEANSAQAIAESETKYEVQKKENTILQQKYSLQRSRFLLLGSVALLAMAIIIAYFVFRDSRRKQKLKMEMALADERVRAETAVKSAEEKERMRIAADLHDNLGVYAASMSSNISYIQPFEGDEKTKQAFHELKKNSGAIISELNDTIWVLKKESLLLTAVSDRIKVFMSRISKSYPHIQMEVNETISNDILFSSAQAFHLYRIVQEAVNNALKYSNGTKINITIQSDAKWQLTVEDDGKGMPEKITAGEGGNGLINMKNRAAEAGWTINWLARQGGGTIVKIASTTN